jgi:hypothetical protein
MNATLGAFSADPGTIKRGYESHDIIVAFKTSPWPLLGKEGKTIIS